MSWRAAGAVLLCAAAANLTGVAHATTTAPADTAADYWIVGTDQAGKRLMAFDPAVTDWNSAAALKWSWTPTAALGFSSAEVSAFTNVADAKLRNRVGGGQSFVVDGGGGLAAVVAYPSGTRQWAKVISGNLHAAELLPDGNIAIAASTGGWVRVYASSQGANAATYAQFTLTDAHAALWDPAIRRLWTVGELPGTTQYVLTALVVGGTPAAPTLREDTGRRVNLPGSGGHDVYSYAYDTGKLWVTNGGGAYLYDKATKAFTSAPGGAGRSGVKSIGNQPSGQIVETKPDSAKSPPGACTLSTWCTDTVDFFNPPMTRTRTGAAFYKARVWTPYYSVVDQTLRGTVWDRSLDTAGAWSDPARVDANGAIGAVAAAALPDGSLHVETLVPGSGVWDRARAADGTWSAAAKIDTAGTITAVSAVALPDGSLHVQTLVPGAGVYDRTRGAAGAWSAATRIDTDGTVAALAAAGLPDGTLHVVTAVPGTGVNDRTRSAAGAWSGTTTVDTNGSISAVSLAALPDGSLHVQTTVPGFGSWDRVRAATGPWSASAVKLDANGSVLATYAAGLPDGTLHVGSLPDIS